MNGFPVFVITSHGENFQLSSTLWEKPTFHCRNTSYIGTYYTYKIKHPSSGLWVVILCYIDSKTKASCTTVIATCVSLAATSISTGCLKSPSAADNFRVDLIPTCVLIFVRIPGKCLVFSE